MAKEMQPFPFKGPQNFSQIGILDKKIYHLATLLRGPYSCVFPEPVRTIYFLKRRRQQNWRKKHFEAVIKIFPQPLRRSGLEF
jgi:hypothetical protein